MEKSCFILATLTNKKKLFSFFSQDKTPKKPLEKIQKSLSEKSDLPIFCLEPALDLSPFNFCFVLPFYSCFSTFLSGEIARELFTLFPKEEKKIFWISSYGAHPAFVRAYQDAISASLHEKNLLEEEIELQFTSPISSQEPLFSLESRLSFKRILKGFPLAIGSFLEKTSNRKILTIPFIDLLSPSEESVLLEDFSFFLELFSEGRFTPNALLRENL